MRIAVVGAGVAGSSVVKTILTHPNFSDRDDIEVFEPRRELGTGFPYAPDDEIAMLNNSPKDLSVDANRPDDFIEWLERNGIEENAEGLIPRPAYGRYLQEHFAASFDHPQVSHIQEEVHDMEVLGSSTYRLKTAEGWAENIYDAVFFAVGHPPYRDDYRLVGAKNYIQNPYPIKEKLTHFEKNQKIGVIGSGTTSIDLMRYFAQKEELQNPLTFYVRKNAFYFPRVPLEDTDIAFTFSKAWIAEQKEKNLGFIPFDQMLQTFRSDLATHGVDAGKVYMAYKEDDFETKCHALENNDQALALVQAYVGRLGHFLPELFQSLSPEDRDHYLEAYYGKLLFFRSLVPTKSFLRLIELYQKGNIRVVNGLDEIRPQPDGTFIVQAALTETVDVIINATGFETNLLRVAERNKLVHHLYHKQLITADRNQQHIRVEWPSCQIITATEETLENVFWLGFLIRGAHHENNDAKVISLQASETANLMMNKKCENISLESQIYSI